MKKGMGFTLVIALLCLCLGSITVMAEGIGSWTTKAPMPTERGYLEAAVVNGIIYTFGGYNQNSYSAAVEAFNPLTNTWVGKAGMTSARAYFGAAEVSGKIYVLGGIGIQGGYLSLVEEYDPAKNLWTKKAPMLTARDAHAAVACNGKIYIIGGNGQSGILSSVEEYNPATNLWTTKASIPKESQGLRAATVNGKIYVFGGRDNSGITQVVYEYNPITDLWLNKTSMPVKKEKFAVEVLDSKIYIIGGNDANMLSSVEEYDPTTNTWSTKESMQKEVSCLTAGQANGKIYAIGGHTGYNWTGETQEYTLAKSTKPNAPNNLKTNLRMQRLNLGWEPVTGATSYNVKRATTSGGPYTTISSNLTDTAYTDTSVVTNTTYYYVVSAVNSAGESANSNEVSAMFTDQSIIPNLITDKEKYIQDDIVPLSLILTNAQAGDKTNSVTFEVEYDSSTFELANTDPNVSVANGYIPFDTKLSLGTGTTKTVHITYLNMDNDIPLQEGQKVFTINFKVKKNPQPGIKTFKLRPVNMLDTSYKVYNINNGQPVTKTVEITDDGVIEGYVNLYLGDNGTDLNTAILGSLSQSQINAALSALKFTLKKDTNDAGTVLNGADVFIPYESGNLGMVDANNKLTAKFRIYTKDTANTLLKIDGVGYLSKETNVTVNPQQVYTAYSQANPLVLYPGDVAQVINRQLVLTPDGNVNNIDFSGWLQLYKNNATANITAQDKLRADFTKDGVIDNVDFSLWLATYKKLLVTGQ